MRKAHDYWPNCPSAFHRGKAINSPTGNITMATKAERKCSKTGIVHRRHTMLSSRQGRLRVFDRGKDQVRTVIDRYDLQPALGKLLGNHLEL